MKLTKRVAVIDVGSNTIRFVIANVSDRKIEKIHNERVVTRLGKELEKNKVLSKESVEKSLKFLEKFKAISETFHVDKLITIGTSALRDAEDGEIFCELIKEKIGIELKVITGDEEAYFTIEGIKAGIENLTPPILAADIGGGSIDWVYENGYTDRGSINFGVVKVSEKFYYQEPNLERASNNLRNFLIELLKSSLPKRKIKNLIATGGTPVTIAMIELKQTEYNPSVIHGTLLSTDKLKGMVNQIIVTNLENWENSIYIPKDRFDILLPGMIILETLADYFETKSILISDYGIIEGIMINHQRFCYNNKL